jgi:hypothetical protein
MSKDSMLIADPRSILEFSVYQGQRTLDLANKVAMLISYDDNWEDVFNIARSIGASTDEAEDIADEFVKGGGGD